MRTVVHPLHRTPCARTRPVPSNSDRRDPSRRWRGWLRWGGVGFAVITVCVAATVLAGFMARGPRGHSRISEAESEVSNLSQMITQFYVFRGEYPTTLHALVHPPSGMAAIAESIPIDPWGHAYRYVRIDANTYRICSTGPDGDSGGGDNVWPDTAPRHQRSRPCPWPKSTHAPDRLRALLHIGVTVLGLIGFGALVAHSKNRHLRYPTHARLAWDPNDP